MNNLCNIGENLKQARLYLNIKATDLAAEFNIPYRTYQGYERNERNMPYNLLAQIVHKYNLSLYFIFFGEYPILKKTNTLNKINFNTINIERLSNNIIKIMDKNDLSNGDMAKLTKVSESDFVKISVGKKLPDLDFLNNLKANFDVDIDWLLYGDAEPPTSKKEVSNADKNLPPLTSEQYQKLLKLLQDI